LILQQALNLARQKLGSDISLEDSLFEAEILVREALQIDRIQLRLQGERRLSTEQEQMLGRLLERRLGGEPLAYILGRREFFNLDVAVDGRVLIPRPESELLVEEALRRAGEIHAPLIADVGTGSGAIAVALAVNLPGATIFATDISPEALEVAMLNCQRHSLNKRVRLLQGDLLQPLPVPVDILLANLPYVRTADFLRMPSARFEPRLALDGGESGLEYYPRFCAELAGKIRPGGSVLVEVGAGQCHQVAEWLRGTDPQGQIEFLKDLAGIERVAALRLSHRPG
jgi:release factor glutamine methyltransferase